MNIHPISLKMRSISLLKLLKCCARMLKRSVKFLKYYQASKYCEK